MSSHTVSSLGKYFYLGDHSDVQPVSPHVSISSVVLTEEILTWEETVDVDVRSLSLFSGRYFSHRNYSDVKSVSSPVKYFSVETTVMSNQFLLQLSIFFCGNHSDVQSVSSPGEYFSRRDHSDVQPFSPSGKYFHLGDHSDVQPVCSSCMQVFI